MTSSPAEAEALALLQSGRLAEAEAAWRAILARKPDDAAALHFLGCILAQTRRGAEGLALIDRSLAISPRNAAFLNNRARVLGDAGRFEDALRDLRRAVQSDARFFTGFFHLGGLLRTLGRFDEAVTALRRAVALEPRHPEALLRLGHALQATGRIDEAIAHYSRAVAARPAFPEALLNWGNALKDRGDLEGARELYGRALELRPDFTEALVNRAGACLDLERLDEARASYRRALEMRPGFANACYGLAQIALREGRFAEGWKDYERRFDTDPPQATRRAIALPRLAPGDLARARRVAVWAEQGVGDQVLFSTLLPELVERGIGAVVEVDPRLVAAYRRSLPALEFTTSENAQADFAACDFQIPIGSLPLLFRGDAASFERQPRALLQPDAARVREMRELLGAGRYIAISWRSLQKGDRQALAERKSIPLAHFAALAKDSGARLLDLQYGDVEKERAQFDAAHPGVLGRIEGLDTFQDLEGVLAATAACEAVVTASNVTAHLAGALGKPTTLLYLRGWPPFHYWAAGPDGRSLWYPGIRVAGDAQCRDWDGVFEAIAAASAKGMPQG
jgi:tetratricopeptide (TPR) repeat protein